MRGKIFIALGTLEYKEKEPPYPFYNNWHVKYGYDSHDENYVWWIIILNNIHL